MLSTRHAAPPKKSNKRNHPQDQDVDSSNKRINNDFDNLVHNQTPKRIYYIVQPQNPQRLKTSSYKDLAFTLLDLNKDNYKKTIIYFDSCFHVSDAGKVLQSLVPPEQKSKIGFLSQILSMGYRKQVEQDFQEGKILLLLTSELLPSMDGYLDQVQDIQRVVQWGLPVTLEVLIRRLDRAAQNPERYGQGILMAPNECPSNMEKDLKRFVTATTCRRQVLNDIFRDHYMESKSENINIYHTRSLVCCSMHQHKRGRLNDKDTFYNDITRKRATVETELPTQPCFNISTTPVEPQTVKQQKQKHLLDSDSNSDSDDDDDDDNGDPVVEEEAAVDLSIFETPEV
ncbi:hypothetical protein BGZ83_001292 [Gryganskiella cystojenkinii]|nr:hypothetical protein BGZ83_001292 [Gryganskiella cystojenkinii]